MPRIPHKKHKTCGGRASLSPGDIAHVARTCHCTEDKALELLFRSENDPKKAVQRYNLLKKYLGPPALSQRNDSDPNRTISRHMSLLDIPMGNDTDGEAPGPQPTDDEVTSDCPRPHAIPPTIHHHDMQIPMRPSSCINFDPTESTQPDHDSAGTPTSTDNTIQGQEHIISGTSLVDVFDVTNELTEWDFILPRINPSALLLPGATFDLDNVASALLYGTDLETVETYLHSYERHVVKYNLGDRVRGFPSIFYAVASNNEAMVRMWVDYGADVTAIHEPSGTPLLAFAVIHSSNIRADTTSMVATLLSLGAEPNVIPPEIYQPYDEDLPDEQPAPHNQDANHKWCKGLAWKKLLQTANLMQRYYLDRASKLKRPSIRQRQVAKLRNAEAILGLPYFLIGQNLAANRLLQKLLSYLVMPSGRPLVLLFAGPSGHGKTELARRLGYLLDLDLEVADCTIVRREMELFGPRHPLVGADKGSSLNNFIAKHAGQRCIVFLDEFEKTTDEVRQALLLPFDNGEYQDRRFGTKVNCSKTIWILATNAMDSTILDFCGQNDEIFSDDEAKKQVLTKKLSKLLKEQSGAEFGNPVTGRISDFIPFLEFSQGEQAVVVGKFLLELVRQVMNPVVLSRDGTGQLLGDVRLRILHDASVCRVLAKEFYNRQTGARSLTAAAEMVRDGDDMLIEKYLDENGEIVAGAEVKDFCIDVKGDSVVVYKTQESAQV